MQPGLGDRTSPESLFGLRLLVAFGSVPFLLLFGAVGLLELTQNLWIALPLPGVGLSLWAVCVARAWKRHASQLAALRLERERLGRHAARCQERARSLLDQGLSLGARVREALGPLERSEAGHAGALAEASSVIAEVHESIAAMHQDLDELSSATEEGSSSMLELGSSITEIARNAAALEESADASTATIHEMSGSIHQVASNADAVQGMAEETAAAMTEMDRAIHEVSEHVREASVLTERLSEGAEEGSSAVASTIEGMDTIRKLTSDAHQVLGRLADRTTEIGEILTVIGGVNEETNLLSLNAAIIAAQAGEQGKAFAVVANHVKTLAERTATSTQEIERLIRAVQQESANAVHAMGTGIDAVEAGVERSRRAGEALEAIRTSAHDASSRVSEIARAAVEQSRNSKHVAEAARRTSEMVQEITRALAEQRRASDQMLRNAEAALEASRQVHRSTREQRESSQFVVERIASIHAMIESIQTSAERHASAAQTLAVGIRGCLELSNAAEGAIPAVISLMDGFAREAESLGSDEGRAPQAPGAGDR